MRHADHSPSPHHEPPSDPFLNAEEAWFWYMRCQRMRWDRANPIKGLGLSMRPCDADDVYRTVIGLFHQGRIHRGHLRVLGTYGLRDCAPDPRCREEEWAAHRWDEAMDRMTTVFRHKGIVE